MVIPELLNEKSDDVIEEETLTTCMEDIHKVKTNRPSYSVLM